MFSARQYEYKGAAKDTVQDPPDRTTRMKNILFVTVVGITMSVTTPTPKLLLMRKITELVTEFLTDDQLSKVFYENFSQAIDIAALEIHNGKRAEEIMSELYDYFTNALNKEQLKTLTKGYKGLVKDLGDEGAAGVMERVKKVVAYAVTPAMETISEQGETPDLAYLAMSRQMTPDFMKIVAGLVRDTLTPTEWNSVKLNYGAMFKISSGKSIATMHHQLNSMIYYNDVRMHSERSIFSSSPMKRARIYE
ncbi:hypothetical protein NECAME_01822 [Necator americanus]|uniref:Nematode fatty acid retinoid binding protein n=1 Tax=Necator americanus TaxID=51031 RepID=W2TMM2_NECAM|nr:hypothetical protein NECAME_01822 [Necator americanus]ETN83023.1 hypothetical protein NECAME_01822 [Necator americanus]